MQYLSNIMLKWHNSFIVRLYVINQMYLSSLPFHLSTLEANCCIFTCAHCTHCQGNIIGIPMINIYVFQNTVIILYKTYASALITWFPNKTAFVKGRSSSYWINVLMNKCIVTGLDLFGTPCFTQRNLSSTLVHH